jgi:hypothetical protein
MAAERRNDEETVLHLHDGESLVFSSVEAERLYDELWLLARRTKGAVTAAAKLKHVATWDVLHGDDPLTEEETAAVRDALERCALYSAEQASD